MRTDSLRKLLQEVRNGQLDIENALTKLKALPNLGIARIDYHRDLRKGLPPEERDKNNICPHHH
jgi:NCAIR mutase (PurE)-related protein